MRKHRKYTWDWSKGGDTETPVHSQTEQKCHLSGAMQNRQILYASGQK